jgi:SAM-dependent methyltransferase
MTWMEKLFVNAEGHARQVARRAERLVRLADPRPGWRLLDVGCGTGAAAIHLAATLGLEVAGVDVDPRQVALARARARGAPRVTFAEGDARSLPFPDGYFDVVTSFHATHHVRGWERAVQEMVRVLRAGPAAAGGGFLVYADLVVPRPIDLALSLGAGRPPFPSARAVDRLAREARLEVVSRDASPFRYEAVFRRAGAS